MRHPVRPLRHRRRQDGLALLLIIGVLGLGATLMLVRALNEAALGEPRRLGNARVLEDAKAALLMYVNTQAASEAHPGKLPCPEDTTKIGLPTEGEAKSYCSLPAFGRLPWKTLGYPTAPLDLDGEQLWYAVSPGFNRANSGVSLVINSNTPAGLTVDGSPSRAVALIFSPGRRIASQNRPAVSSGSPPVAANYLEGENATLDISFATYGPAKSQATSFNDQAVIITHRDLFTVVEMAVARRINDTLVSGTTPLKDVYVDPDPDKWSKINIWGSASGGRPLLPFAAPFGNPETSTYQGVSTNTTSQGLLPLSFATSSSDATQYCNPATDGARCAPTFVQWVSFQSLAKAGGGLSISLLPAPTCTVSASDLSCTMYNLSTGTLTVTVVATASNVAMALRQQDPDAPSLSDFNSSGRAMSVRFNSNGSAEMSFTGTLAGNGTLGFFGCPGGFFGLCYRRTFSIPIRIFADHPLLSSTNAETGWFMTNEWYKLTYYAASELSTARASGPSPCADPNCLTVNNTPNDNKRAILILAGRAIGTQSRPSAALANYLESENLTPVDSTFVTLKSSLQSNDRVVILDSNP